MKKNNVSTYISMSKTDIAKMLVDALEKNKFLQDENERLINEMVRIHQEYLRLSENYKILSAKHNIILRIYEKN